ncbi:alpha/beta fold hydrolase [Streptomyces sp. NPDC058171]
MRQDRTATGAEHTAGHTQGVVGRARTRDGRTLYYQRRTARPPGAAATVVFEGGLAASRSYWALVQEELADDADTVVYDRSGLGRSPRARAPRTLERLARDLGDLLDHLGPGPFVLAGHSWGGPVVRVAAAAAPGRIAGVVLVDATDEACEPLFDPASRALERAAQRKSAELARTGQLGPAFRPLTDALPPDAGADMRREGFTPRAMRTRGAELAAVTDGLRSLLERPPQLGDVPVTVVSAALETPGMAPELRAALDAAHAHRAAESRRGRHVYALRSGHMVPVGEPRIIAEEIRRLLG